MTIGSVKTGAVGIGFVGTGLMGQPMAERLLSQRSLPATQPPLVVYNRTPEKLEPLRLAGATIATDPVELLRSVECVVLMLTDAAAIQAVLLPTGSQAMLAGKTVIQMGTIAPEESRAIRDAVVAAGGEYLEAPVLGSIPEAKGGQLRVMVGSTPEQFDRWREVLQCFGPEPLWVGEVGTAAALKLALNQLIGSLTTAFATSLSFVQQQQVPVETLMQVLRPSALYAPTFDKKLQRMRDRHYADPNFPTKHLLKDMKLFLQAASAEGLNTESVAAVCHILERTLELGLADADYSALMAAISPAE